MDKFKKHQKFFILFFILSGVGLIDMATRAIILQQKGLNDTGVISYYLGIGVSIVLGATIGSAIMVAVSLILSFTIVWVGIAIYEYTRMNKYKKLQQNNQDSSSKAS